jgi:hypothetical protein
MEKLTGVNPMTTEIVETVARALDWRVPDEGELGHEDGVLTALGIGGSYDIGEQSDGYILWWAADPFTFQEGFATIADAKAAAEADWQKSITAALRAGLVAENERLRLQVVRTAGMLVEAAGGEIKVPLGVLERVPGLVLEKEHEVHSGCEIYRTRAALQSDTAQEEQVK